MPLEYRFTGVSMKGPTSANSTISSNRRWISVRLMFRIAPLRKTFSRPVSSGWNPVPTSSSAPTRPRRRASPSVGGVIRERIFRSVLLPAPLCPMTPNISPGRTSNSMSRSAQNSCFLGRRPRRRNRSAICSVSSMYPPVVSPISNRLASPLTSMTASLI